MSLETPARIEPCLLETYPSELADAVAELVGAASKLGARLHPTSAESLAELVRVMNCYYSNLIEGHNTRPRDIERALVDDLDRDARRRDLQIEARAVSPAVRGAGAMSARAYFFCALAQPSLSWMVRLKTSAPGLESTSSTQK